MPNSTSAAAAGAKSHYGAPDNPVVGARQNWRTQCAYVDDDNDDDDGDNTMSAKNAESI